MDFNAMHLFFTGQFLMTFQGKYPLFTTLNPDVNPLPACMAKSRDDRYMSKFLPGNYSGSLWSPAMLTLAGEHHI